jgi:adenine-specific DNA-methyltransferase
LRVLASNELVFTGGGGNISVSYKQYLRDERGQKRGAKPFSIIDRAYTQQGTADLAEVFDGKAEIQFPKPVALMRKLLDVGTNAEDGDIVMDFFAGSCTTAQAVLELNREDGGNRRFIMVQLPEPTGSEDFPTIADVGKERICRVIAKLQNEKEGKLDVDARDTPEDLSFRVFKLSESHYKPWATVEDKDPEAYAKQMELHLDPLISGWKAENLIWEVAVKEGYGLNSRVELLEELAGNIFYRVTDPDKGQSFLICLDSSLKPEAVKAISLSKEDLFICRDVALSDEMAANLALQCRLKTI